MTTSGTTNDNEWHNEWQRVVQQVTTSGNEDSEWQQRTMSDSECQKVVQWVKTAQHTSKNGWLQFFLPQKEWMAATTPLKKFTLDDRIDGSSWSFKRSQYS